jgi:exonuclease SbcC
MRPLRLTIEGLTAFRKEQVIDFTDLDLFVVTGPTGAGKSTILDAMVLALYGAIPRMTTGPSALVTHGETMARVKLEFSADGETYLVARRLPKRAAQSATLERRDGDDWVTAVEGGGVRAVNARLEEIIGLDFDGFTRAVLLPQGEFAGFLRGKKEQRREILVRLLDLGRYERAGQLARDEASRIETEAAAVARLIESEYAGLTETAAADAGASVEVARAAAAKLAEAEEKAIRIGDGLAALSEGLSALDRDQGLLNEVKGALGRIAADWADLEPQQVAGDVSLADAAAALEAADSAYGAAAMALDEMTARTGGEGELATLKAALEKATEARAALSKAESEAGTARTEADRLENALASAERALDSARTRDAVARAADEAVRRREMEVSDRLRRAEERAMLEERCAGRAEEAARLHDELARHEAAVAEAEVTLVAAEEHHAHVRIGHEAVHLRATLVPGEPCPVCLQRVPAIPDGPDLSSVSDAEAARKSAQKRVKDAERQATAARGEVVAAESMLAAAREALSVADTDADVSEVRTVLAGIIEESAAATRERLAADAMLRKATGEHGPLVAGLAGARASVAAHDRTSEDARTRLAAAEAILARSFPAGVPDDLAGAIAKRLAELHAARDREAKARKARDAARDERDEAQRDRQTVANQVMRLMQQCEGQRGKLLGLAGRVDAEPLPLSGTDDVEIGAEIALLSDWTGGAQDRLKSRRKRLVVDRARQTAALAAVLSGAGLDVAPDEPARGLAALRKALQKVLGDVARAESTATRLRENLARRRALEEQIAADSARQQLYSALAAELRKDRFVDFLIAESVERLAVMASEELRRISNDRYSLRADETAFVVVDHANANETRSVETLSGGETFLASLSLATALAGSITDIAGEAIGARLEAMFIDEGFGTLDDESLDAVIDALERLRESDRLVGVITHVPQLAERIPDGIRVQRGTGGSVIRRRGP